MYIHICGLWEVELFWEERGPFKKRNQGSFERKRALLRENRALLTPRLREVGLFWENYSSFEGGWGSFKREWGCFEGKWGSFDTLIFCEPSKSLHIDHRGFLREKTTLSRENRALLRTNNTLLASEFSRNRATALFWEEIGLFGEEIGNRAVLRQTSKETGLFWGQTKIWWLNSLGSIMEICTHEQQGFVGKK